jgi:hypothetical protein
LASLFIGVIPKSELFKVSAVNKDAPPDAAHW